MNDEIEKIITGLLELRHTCATAYPKCKDEQFSITRVLSSDYPSKEHWRFDCSHSVPSGLSTVWDFESYELARNYLASFIAAIIERDCQTFLSTPNDELGHIPGGMAHWHKVLNELVTLQRLLLAHNRVEP